MALTPERIMELEQQSYVKGHRPVSTEDCWGDEKITYEPTEHFNMFMFARAIEAEARRDALEEAAAAVEKATCRKRWAKAAVNSHPDDVPPCEFATLIRAMKEPTP